MRDERKDLVLGRMALSEGYVSQSQINDCVEAQAEVPHPEPLGQMLVGRGMMTEVQLSVLLERQEGELAGTASADLPLIGRLAIERGYCTLEQVNACLQDQCSQEQRGSQVFLGQLLLKNRHITGAQFMTLLKQSEAPEFDTLSSDDGPGEACDTPDLIARGQIGKYEILYEISRGGMGVVYKARHKQLGKEVALKILRRGKISDRRIQRFKQEGQLVAQLTHRNIVQIYDWSEEEGIYYFTMEFIEGMPLDEHCAHHPMSEQASARIVRTMAEAVHYAHERGIIHRDLKPANIMIDPEGEPHLTDFGLAKSLLRDLELTKLGQALGTPSYMPPEQARGDKSTTDQRSDVYSLGAIFYELLAGQPPFANVNPFNYYSVILEEEPESIRSLNPAVSEKALRICQCAMAKEPAGRYGTAQAMADDLEALLAGEKIRAGTLNQSISRNKWSIVGAALLILLGIGGAALLGQLIKNHRRKGRIERAVSATERAIEQDAYASLPEIFHKLEAYRVPPDRVLRLRKQAESRLLTQAHKALRETRAGDLARLLGHLEQLAPGHPDHELLATGLAQSLQARTAPAKTKKTNHPPKIPWQIPRKLRTTGQASWKTGSGTIEARGGKDHGFIHLGRTEWRDYRLRFELRVTRGSLGMFLRGMAKGCQFPKLLEAFALEPAAARWRQVRASVIGNQVRVQIDDLPPIYRTNSEFTDGILGFAAHPGALFQIRKLRVHVLEPR